MQGKMRWGERPLRYFLILALLMPFLWPNQRVYACMCVGPDSPEKELRRATAVFSGKVVGTSGGLLPYIFNASEEPFGPSKITIETAEIWKGAPYQYLVVNTDFVCSLNLALGKDYLIYAYGQQDHLSGGLCSRAPLLADASKDLAALGIGSAPALPGSNEPIPVSNLSWILVLCTPILLLAATTFLLIKRRRKPIALRDD